MKVREGDGGIRGRERIHFLGGLIEGFTGGDFGSLGTDFEEWDLQCTPGLRGFGLGGLGRP